MLPSVLRLTPFFCFFVAILVGCSPEIGDKCDDSIECAVDGSRFCDYTQPSGYCLIPGCRADECPEEAVCVSFREDESARTFCMKHCENNGDCRGGYHCAAPTDQNAEPTTQEVYTEIIDDYPEGSRFCIERPPE